eukprot:2984074-Karenia_brevis.AAC.1
MCEHPLGQMCLKFAQDGPGWFKMLQVGLGFPSRCILMSMLFTHSPNVRQLNPDLVPALDPNHAQDT